jgi:ADP-dependent NAD(P)H-hydrate dehydratase / NAD(P)H-hydrate epimerase
MALSVLSIAEIREIEAAADAAGYPFSQMMEDAGKAAAERVIHWLEGVVQPKITVLVGGGNNGGDGLVAGRIIAQQIPDAQVRFYLTSERDESDENLRKVQDAGLFVAQSSDDRDQRVLRNMVASADVVIDALLGIGVTLPLKQPLQRILRGVHQALEERAKASRLRTLAIDPTAANQIEHPPKQFILAIDCPSGLDCDTGAVDPTTLYADETVTFIAVKPGLLTFPGAAAVGKLVIAPLEMPEDLPQLKKVKIHLLDHAFIEAMLPTRAADSHKGTFGKVMVIAGSSNFSGAALLCSRAAYKSGAGLITMGVPAPLGIGLAGQLPEATWLLLAHDMGVLSANTADTILKEVEGYKSLLIGPGLGREHTTQEMLERLLAYKGNASKRNIGFGVMDEADDSEISEIQLPPTVIDADGLNMLSQIEEWWKLLPSQTILTPHPAEMGRLSGMSTEEVQSQRLELAKTKAAAWNTVVVLKGASTIIASPNGEIAFSPFKTDALATAGTGDVLAGLIAGLLAQGLKPFEAAQVGVYLHGLAGVKAAEQAGNGRSVMAGDVLDAISDAYREFA